MKKEWSDAAWDDYLYWQTQDKKTLKKINALIKDIDRNGVNGLGKSEPLSSVSESSVIKKSFDYIFIIRVKTLLN